jgi:hypothetical protein
VSVTLVQKPQWADLRSLLVLGRVSNLPTVWSNCLAGWLLAGGGTVTRFGLLCLGASFLYVAGMFLNDAFDAEFDRQHRKERPIPSGAITVGKVWGWGFGWLFAGLLLLSLLGNGVLAISLLLCASILAYDAIHKAITLSPVLMALCRFLLYLLAAAATARGVTGLSVWTGLTLAIYVLGLTYIARRESARGPVRHWPSWALLTPFVMAWVINAGSHRARVLLFSLLLAAWVVHCLRRLFWTSSVTVSRAVSGLLAGICLVDLLAVNPSSVLTALGFLALFGAALLFQRVVPAT